MRPLPLIDDTPTPYDYPRRLWEYRVEFIRPGFRAIGGARDVVHVSAETSSKAKYAAALQLYGKPSDAMYACWLHCLSARRVT